MLPLMRLLLILIALLSVAAAQNAPSGSAPNEAKSSTVPLPHFEDIAREFIGKDQQVAILRPVIGGRVSDFVEAIGNFR